MNSILLIRNERATCAIRFLSYRRANDARPPTSFDTGDASRFAVYEIAEFIHGPERAIEPVMRKELDYRGLRGLGRLAFNVGNNTISCGRHKYSWMFPTGLLIKKEQSDTFVAPTNWTSFDELRVDHPGLHWYQRDAQTKRAVIMLPKEELLSSSSR